MNENRKELDLLQDAARLALLKGNHQHSYNLLMDLLKRAPDYADAYFLLSRIAYDYKNHLKEVEMLEIAYRIEPNNTLFISYLARAQTLVGNSTEAIRLLHIAEQLDDHTAETFDLLGVTCNRLNMYREASNFFRNVVARGPADAGVYFNLASTLKFCGDFTEARLAYEKAITLKPDYYKAHAALTSLGGINEQYNHVEPLQNLLHSAQTADDALCIAHALSKELEVLKRFDEAFAVLSLAKERKTEAINYNFSRYPPIFAALKKHVPKTSSPQPVHTTSPIHIFVVGMPRTGTTLVERILSNHRCVATGGELYNFSIALKHQLGSNSTEFIETSFMDRLTDIDFAQLGNDYTEGTSYLLTGDKDILIDKLPLNILYAGLIATALPTSKIICLDRQPMDTITSNYRQLFSFYDSTFCYSLNLEDTANFYIEFRQLINHWLTGYPNNFYLINYEALVSNPDIEIRKLLAFCELDWDDKCLAIENNTQPVATASAVQVRQPISTKSVGQWRDYERHLDKVFYILKSAGIDITN